MAAFTGLALGVASMGYGMYQSAQGRSQAQRGYEQQQQGAMFQGIAAQGRAQVSREQAASSEEAAYQNRNLEFLMAQQSLDAFTSSRAINQSTIAAERANEALRRQAMELDGRRKGLEIIRNQQRARAIGLVNATAQGASRGSGLQGGYGQIAGQSNNMLLALSQNLDIGRNTFANNAQISQNRLAMSDLEMLYAQQRAANQTAKSQMVYDYAKLNANYQTRLADLETFSAQGGGMISQGQGLVNLGNSQSASGAQFMSMGPQLFGMGQTANNVFQTNFGSNSNNSASMYMNYGAAGTYGVPTYT